MIASVFWDYFLANPFHLFCCPQGQRACMQPTMALSNVIVNTTLTTNGNQNAYDTKVAPLAYGFCIHMTISVQCRTNLSFTDSVKMSYCILHLDHSQSWLKTSKAQHEQSSKSINSTHADTHCILT